MKHLDLSNFPLLSDPITQRLFSALTNAEIEAKFVGGCVRDALLGSATDDIDIAVAATPDEVTQALQKAYIKVVPTGLDHGTVTAVVDGRPFQITSLRADTETHGRHATVTFGTSWEEDAKRRDFTFNAIYADIDGNLYDPFNGIVDLDAKHVRFIGSPEKRIKEDYLRILRYFRFHARFGDEDYDPKAHQAILENLDGFAKLSRERVRDEFLKLLQANDPTLALEMMDETGVLPLVISEIFALEPLARLVALEEKYQTRLSFMRRLFILIPESACEKGVAQSLKLSNKQSGYLTYCRRRLHTYQQESEPSLSRLYRDGVETFQDLVLVTAALSNSSTDLTETLELAQNWTSPQFPLTGEDLLDLGLPPGPKIGKLLKTCEKWWVSEGFRPTKQACLAFVKETL